MGERSDQVKAIFLKAIEEHTQQHWPAYLDDACAGDTLLRSEVEKLLRAQAELGSFHEAQQATLPATRDVGVTERPGAIIGAYTLQERIGEGGMGVVYRAEQKQPVRRLVALKIIKPGMDTAQVIARFDAERQALALMNHPNIAKVLEAGQTSSARPYFVMDLVRGVPITEQCDQSNLTIRQRLELFIDV